MKINNYYENLSQVQKQKKAEKLGNLCYYEWFDTLYEEYTLEEAGAILLGLMFYDRTGGTQPLPKDLEEIIDKDRATRTLFVTLMDKTAAATKEWINKHKLKNKAEQEIEESEEKEEIKDNPKALEIIPVKSSVVEKVHVLYPDNDKYTIVCPLEKQKNTPTTEQLQKVFEEVGGDAVIIEELVDRGNTEKWERTYTAYKDEIMLDLGEDYT